MLDKVNSNEKLRRPFVTLEVNPNPDNIYQTLPDFTITGYSDDLEDVVLPGDKPKAAADKRQRAEKCAFAKQRHGRRHTF